MIAETCLCLCVYSLLTCSEETEVISYLSESEYTRLIQFNIHLFAIRKIHNNFVVFREFQQLGRFTVGFNIPAFVCFVEYKINSFVITYINDYGGHPELRFACNGSVCNAVPETKK